MTGTWWNPEKPAKKIRGNVIMDTGNSGRLVTGDYIGDAEDDVFSFIYGLLDDGTNITLRSVTAGSSFSSFTADGEVKIYEYGFAEMYKGPPGTAEGNK
jgi:hypothetical protein